MKEIKVALLGFGGIAKSHKKGYDLLAAEGANVRLVAVCDINPDQFEKLAAGINLGSEGTLSLADLHTYTDCDEMLAKEEIDMVDICLPTYLHKEYTIRMLKAGKHVLCEKPMALCSADCEEMLRVAKECDRQLMIGQCLRFEPSYLFLKDCIDDGRFGKLRSLFMDRLSGQPKWGFENWFADTEKSGGCIMDMHIHDVDMARFLLGEPTAVSCVAYDGVARWAMENTRLYYDDVMVVANGSWEESGTRKFQMSFIARFEQAEVILDSQGLTVYPNEGEPYAPELSGKNRMAEEIRLLAMTIADPAVKNEANPPESACKTVRLIEKLRESAAQNGAIITL